MPEYVAVVHCPEYESWKVYFNDFDKLDDFCSATNQSTGFRIDVYVLVSGVDYRHVYTFN